jgi:hypothetical protein
MHLRDPGLPIVPDEPDSESTPPSPEPSS